MRADVVRVIPVFVTLLAAGAGCGDTSVDNGMNQLPGRPTTTTASVIMPEHEPPWLNERGYLVESLGEPIVWGLAPSHDDVVFTIDRIEVDPKCDESLAGPQDRRHTLAIQVRVTTGNDERAADLASGVVNPWNLAEVGTTGTFHPASPGRCRRDRLPTNFDANRKYRGVIEVEVPAASGIIAMKNTGSTTAVKGWKWHYRGVAGQQAGSSAGA